MIYVGADFFLALLKPGEQLQKRAVEFASLNKGELWTSLATMIELLSFAKRQGVDAERLIINALQIVELRGGNLKVLLRAARQVKKHGADVFNAVQTGRWQPDQQP